MPEPCSNLNTQVLLAIGCKPIEGNKRWTSPCGNKLVLPQVSSDLFTCMEYVYPWLTEKTSTITIDCHEGDYFVKSWTPKVSSLFKSDPKFRVESSEGLPHTMCLAVLKIKENL